MTDEERALLMLLYARVNNLNKVILGLLDQTKSLSIEMLNLIDKLKETK